MKNSMQDPTTAGVSSATQVDRVADESQPIGSSVARRPAWSDPALDVGGRGDETHAEDRGVWVEGVVDAWTASEVDGTGKAWTKEVKVALQGFRSDSTLERDWTMVDIAIADTGGTGCTLKGTEDLRRLAKALERAARMIEGCPDWCTDHAGGPLEDDEDACHQSALATIGAHQWCVVQGPEDAGPRLYVYRPHEAFPSAPMSVEETAELLDLLPAAEVAGR